MVILEEGKKVILEESNGWSRMLREAGWHWSDPSTFLFFLSGLCLLFLGGGNEESEVVMVVYEGYIVDFFPIS